MKYLHYVQETCFGVLYVRIGGFEVVKLSLSFNYVDRTSVR